MASKSRPTPKGSRPLSPTAKSDRRAGGKSSGNDTSGSSRQSADRRSAGRQSIGSASGGASLEDNLNVIQLDDQFIDLRNRPLAALLAWLVPGLGHAYQGRYTKAATFAVCILSAWIFGFALGGQHVVYASWQPGDKRWHYGLQFGAGAVALPALIQGRRMNEYTDPVSGRTRGDYRPKWNGFMSPPHRPVSEAQADEVAAWYAVKGAGYEMGTWYTVIAGMLNILVIYDAYGGPLSTSISGRRRDEEEDSSDEPDADDSLERKATEPSEEKDATKEDSSAKANIEKDSAERLA